MFVVVVGVIVVVVVVVVVVVANIVVVFVVFLLLLRHASTGLEASPDLHDGINARLKQQQPGGQTDSRSPQPRLDVRCGGYTIYEPRKKNYTLEGLAQ